MSNTILTTLLVSFGFLLSSCSTGVKTVEVSSYEVNAKVWIAGELTDNLMLRVLGDIPGEIETSQDDESLGMKFVVNEGDDGLYTLNASYAYSKGATAMGENMIIRSRFESPTVIVKDNIKFELSVIKL